MQKELTLRLLPSEAANDSIVRQYIANTTGHTINQVSGFYPIRQSIDARGKQTWINLSVKAYINEPFQQRSLPVLNYQDVHQATKKAVIIGAGPAGLFAALQLIQSGIRPILLERGKDVRSRRRDLALLNKEGIVNPESNYCFGEGGAGTYSDGKLYTRSNKRGDIDKILNQLVHFGAEDKILYESHPHIGTNKLPQIITTIREFIVACGGVFLFEQKVTELIRQNDRITEVRTTSGDRFEAEAFILATGHSARDIFYLLHNQHISIEFKPFALGVRIEHPQQLIDSIQYHCPVRSELLPPASYSLVQQVNGQGVFSFCMCPGGIIAPASTNPGELVVNGWSPSKRNNPYANSGMVVTVEAEHIQAFSKHGPLAGMLFQQSIEQKACQAGGGKQVAPAQRMVDFTQGIVSSTLPANSYIPGLNPINMADVLPPFVFKGLQQAFIEFGKKMRGYFTNDAIVVATESRTSSPVRIPRDPLTLAHPQVANLYPCGEGAGYAGGIISAAMDGEKVATAIATHLSS